MSEMGPTTEMVPCSEHGPGRMWWNEWVEGWECGQCRADIRAADRYNWHWFFVADCTWRWWGLGVELAFGYWSEPEYSIHLHIGPILVAFGRERDYEPING